MDDKAVNLDLYRDAIPLTFTDGITILILSTLIGFIIRYIFYKYSDSMSSKSGFGNAILLVTVSTASLIAIVKSSLALSLGLVGALSVVRFRTAVKEPYNLAFILFAICAGISIGASQYTFGFLITIFSSVIILAIYKIKPKSPYLDQSDTLNLELPSNIELDGVYSILDKNTKKYNILRLTQDSEGKISFVLRAIFKNKSSFELRRKELNENYTNFELSFYQSFES